MPILDEAHDWKLVPEPYVVETCERCGLIKLKTISNSFYFVQIVDPYLQCVTKPSKSKPQSEEHL